jgi:putrescine transport system ATP-binding protein
MLFQRPHMLRMSVRRNLQLGLWLSGVPWRQTDARARQALARVELVHLAERNGRALSGGQQQRVALARSLAKKPKLLLLDEPLGALDKKLREQTQFELVNIIEKVGVTVVMVTHDQEEAMTMASRIAIMSKGRVLQVGTPEEIYEHPRNKFVADFIGNVNLFAGKLTVDEPDRCAATTAIGEVHVGHGVSGTLNMPVSIAVRPEKIEISKTRPEHASFNLFQGKVKEIGYLGSYTTYILVAGDGSRVRVTEANTTRQDLTDITWEDDVYFWWDDNAAVVLRD